MNAPIKTTELLPSLLSLETIRKLVAFDTTSRESNLALIQWVRNYLENQGAVVRLTFDDERKKANLFATLPAQDGNATHGGIVLSGHTDVVPVDGQPWQTSPWEAILIDDKLYGRGVTDMKSFCAIALAFVPEFRQRGLTKPLHIALSYDEEVGCIGVERMIADIGTQGIKPIGCIVGEPTGMQLIVAHKGKQGYRCSVRGHECHSSLTPQGVNAVQIACRIVNYLTDMAQRFRDQGGYDHAYDVPYTTVHTGVIHGGTALNIVPRDCYFDFEFRCLPFDDPEQLLREVEQYAQQFLPEMRALNPDTFISFTHLATLPGMDAGDDSALAKLGKTLAEQSESGKVSFGTEASKFHRAGIPAIICGPGHIEQAHQPNEWVSVEQLACCERFMRRLAEQICFA